MKNSFDYKIIIGVLKRNEDSESLRKFFKLNLNNMLKSKHICFLFVYDNNTSLSPTLVRHLRISDIHAHLSKYLTYKLKNPYKFYKKDNSFLRYAHELELLQLVG